MYTVECQLGCWKVKRDGELFAAAYDEEGARRIARALNMEAAMGEAREALQEATKTASTAGRYFPKSINNRDTFSLNVTRAALTKALAALDRAEGV